MKNSESSSSWEKEEKVKDAFITVSIVGLVIFIISGVLWLSFSKNSMDTIALAGFILFVAPVMVLQVAMSANIGEYGTTSMGFWPGVFFYLIIFPVVNAWFVTAIDAMFHFLPDFRLVADMAMRDECREMTTRLTFEWMGIIYLSLTLIGLIIRLIRKVMKKG